MRITVVSRSNLLKARTARCRSSDYLRVGFAICVIRKRGCRLNREFSVRHLITRIYTGLLIGALLSSSFAILPALAQEHEHSDPMPAGAKLGAVSFAISCKKELQPEFNRAVALLHSFWHSEAQRVFENVAAADPNCAMAYWGVAMSHFHL